ncbi:MAG TPA: hypothetical protein VJH25_00105, partial [Candidatus Paceibacterota bacterium]
IKILETKKDFIDYLTDIMIDSKTAPANVLKQIKQDIFPYVLAIPSDTSRFQAVKKIADKLDVNEDALWKDLQEYAKQNSGQAKNIAVPYQNKTRRIERLESIERKIIGILYSRAYFNGDKEKGRELMKIVGEEKSKTFVSLSSDDIAELTLEAEITYDETDIDKEWQLLLLHLEGEYAKKKLETVMMELHKMEKTTGETREIMEKIQQLTARIQAIKNLTEKI